MEHMSKAEQSGQRKCSHCGLLPFVESLKRTTPIICESPAMQTVMNRAARFALSDAPVVIQGESGTGKEVVARALHANSPRRQQPFIAINCGALPHELLESELFGHSKGAFTGASQHKTGLFESADKGTLFLDEIAEMPLPLQVKLLRALQDGEIRRVGENKAFGVDVRIVCASHQDLKHLMEKGLFRADLFYRIRVLALTIPPLRERSEDILPLARAFIRQFGEPKIVLCPETELLLKSYSWPGNVRELASAIQHGLALAEGTTIQPEDLPDELKVAMRETHWSLAQVERQHIQKVIAFCQGNHAEAARLLGIGRNTLWRKLKSIT